MADMKEWKKQIAKDDARTDSLSPEQVTRLIDFITKQPTFGARALAGKLDKSLLDNISSINSDAKADRDPFNRRDDASIRSLKEFLKEKINPDLQDRDARSGASIFDPDYATNLREIFFDQAGPANVGEDPLDNKLGEPVMPGGYIGRGNTVGRVPSYQTKGVSNHRDEEFLRTILDKLK